MKHDCDVCGRVRRYQGDPHAPHCIYYVRPKGDPKPVKMGPCDCGSAKGGGGHYDWCGSLKPALARVDPIRAAEDFIDAWGQNANEYFVVAANHLHHTACVDKSPSGAGVLWVSPKHLSYPDGMMATDFFPGDLVRLAP